MRNIKKPPIPQKLQVKRIICTYMCRHRNPAILPHIPNFTKVHPIFAKFDHIWKYFCIFGGHILISLSKVSLYLTTLVKFDNVYHICENLATFDPISTHLFDYSQPYLSIGDLICYVLSYITICYNIWHMLPHIRLPYLTSFTRSDHIWSHYFTRFGQHLQYWTKLLTYLFDHILWSHIWRH